MERDFLGIHRKDSKEENRERRQDSGLFGGSPLQWPLSNDLASMHLSFKRPHEDGAKIVQFERNFSLDRQGTCSSGAANHPSNDTRTYPVVSRHSFPMTTGGPFFQVHGAPNVPNVAVSTLKQHLSGGAIPASVYFPGSNMGSYAPRNVANSLPTTAQLTIFYAGSVNVYDDIPLDKAQAIMFLASTGSRSNSNALSQKPETPLLDSNKGLGPNSVSANANQMHTPTPHVTPSSSGLSSPISVTSQNAIHSASSSIDATTDLMQSKVSLYNQNDPSKTVNVSLGSPSSATVMARAVPQARRASLARFLEKRKERVMNTMPYSCTEKSTEEVVVPEKADFRNKPLSPDIALSSNMEHTWQVGRSKKSKVESRESPSTRLGI